MDGALIGGLSTFRDIFERDLAGLSRDDLTGFVRSNRSRMAKRKGDAPVIPDCTLAGLRLILRVGRVLLQDELLDQSIGNSAAGVDESAR